MVQRIAGALQLEIRWCARGTDYFPPSLVNRQEPALFSIHSVNIQWKKYTRTEEIFGLNYLKYAGKKI